MNGTCCRRAIPTGLIPLTAKTAAFNDVLPCLHGLLPQFDQVDAGGNLRRLLRLQRGWTAPERLGAVDIPKECKHGRPRLLHLSEAIGLDEKSTEVKIPNLPNPLPPL